MQITKTLDDKELTWLNGRWNDGSKTVMTDSPPAVPSAVHFLDENFVPVALNIKADGGWELEYKSPSRGQGVLSSSEKCFVWISRNPPLHEQVDELAEKFQEQGLAILQFSERFDISGLVKVMEFYNPVACLPVVDEEMLASLRTAWDGLILRAKLHGTSSGVRHHHFYNIVQYAIESW